MYLKSLITRDPTIKSLEEDVFSKLNELCKEEALINQPKNRFEVKFVSFEDAIKELVEIKKAKNIL